MDESVRIDALGKTAFRGREFLWNLRGGGSVIRKGGDFGDVKNDTELKADKELGEFLAEQVVREFSEVGRVTVEGLGELPGNAGGQLLATIDPIDGSLNYKHCGRMNGFPFTSCITLLEDRGDKTSFAVVVAASVVDLRREVRDIWVVDRSDGYVTRCGQVGESLWLSKTLEADVLHLGQMNVIAEMYYPENREKVFRAFGWRVRLFILPCRDSLQKKTAQLPELVGSLCCLVALQFSAPGSLAVVRARGASTSAERLP